jgi:tRNA U34 5-carboxymethylaminomethyl modifying enzyme MnmG/GidA
MRKISWAALSTLAAKGFAAQSVGLIDDDVLEELKKEKEELDKRKKRLDEAIVIIIEEWAKSYCCYPKSFGKLISPKDILEKAKKNTALGKRFKESLKIHIIKTVMPDFIKTFLKS